MNGVMKRGFHTKTQRGGGRGGTSKILPMLEKGGRGLLWRFGYGDGLFEKMGHGKEMKIEYDSI